MKKNYTVFLIKMAALSLLFALKANAQYTIQSIPFQTYSASATPLTTQDDYCSGVIPLGFNFNFFGTVYNQIVVSTNGYITFNTISANQTSPWAYNTSIPDIGFPVKNAVLGCYHDLDNSNAQGSLTYAITGAAPYRKMVVLFSNQSHFQCTATKSTFQMVLYETLNVIDVQLADKQACVGWNGGRSVTGLINTDGTVAFTPAGRNTGSWTAYHEGWRFTPAYDFNPASFDLYSFISCDGDNDGFAAFNLSVAQNDLLPGNPSAMNFYATIEDAEAFTNPMPLVYTNTTVGSQKIYARATGGSIYEIRLSVLDCTPDYDADSVATSSEDLNNDGNLANDDTDNDGIADFIDNDDDGDMILTQVEYVFGRSSNTTDSLTDTDNDGIANYLDNDDDGDGVLTINEDYNHNNDPSDDDTNANGTADYLETAIALGVPTAAFGKAIALYPNPASTVLNIYNTTGADISNVAIYNVNGQLVKSVNADAALKSIDIAALPSGVYLVSIQAGAKVTNSKLVKQ